MSIQPPKYLFILKKKVMRKKTIFKRKLGDKIVTLTITQSDKELMPDQLNGRDTNKFTGKNFDGVLTNLGFDYTYDLPTCLKMFERRKLYYKGVTEGLSKEQSERMAQIMDELQDTFDNYSDVLFKDFIFALSESKRLDEYHPLNDLTEEQKNERMKRALIILEKLRRKNEKNNI